jgi:hypothetical protein
MSTREERRQQRIARLLERLGTAGASWAAAEYQEGIDTGRHGAVSASVTKRRDQAEQAFRDIVARAPRDARAMMAGLVPRRHWRAYGDDPLPSSAESIALV